MELGNLEETKVAMAAARAEEARQEQGEEVTLLLSIPEKGVQEKSFPVGVTVAYVKLQIEQEFGIAMGKTTLKVNGKTLIDPFSLSDCPGISVGASVPVDVVIS